MQGVITPWLMVVTSNSSTKGWYGMSPPSSEWYDIVWALRLWHAPASAGMIYIAVWAQCIHYQQIQTHFSRACLWVSRSALFWKSQTHSVNDSIYDFDWNSWFQWKCAFWECYKLINMPYFISQCKNTMHDSNPWHHSINVWIFTPIL